MRRSMHKIRRGVLAPSGAFSVSDLQGLSLWIDASMASSISKDGSDYVSAWNDLSGNDRHFSASGTSKPRWFSNQLNGNPGIAFDGVDDFMQSDLTTTAAAAGRVYVFAVITWDGWGAGGAYPRLINWSVDNGQSGTLSIQQSDATYGPFSVGNGGDYVRCAFAGITSPPGLSLAPHHLRLVFDGTDINSASSYTMMVDGVSQSSASKPGGSPNGTNGRNYLCAGNYSGATVGNYAYCRVHELFIVAGTTLSASDLANIDAYIEEKWGI